MSTRHSDREPVAHDTAEKLLDELLEGADADLHAALGDVVDLDAGLTAIVGSNRFERPVIAGPDVVKYSRLARLRCRPQLLSHGGLVLSLIGFTTSLVRVFVRKLFHITTSITTGISSSRQSLTGVSDQINTLVDLLTKINRFTLVPKRRRDVRSCVAQLASLREYLEDGCVSRNEAKTIIARVKMTIEVVPRKVELTFLNMAVTPSFSFFSFY